MRTPVKALLKWLLLIAAYVALGFFVLWMLVLLTIGGAWGHPIDGTKNAGGELCCGEGDCFAIPAQAIRVTARGYEITAAAAMAGGKPMFSAVEIVPYSEAQPSPDGQFWRCKRPDGSRRCFFAPIPNS